MKVSIVAPVYNEESSVEISVNLLLKALKQVKDNWEFILVNDGSTDTTLSKLRALAKKNKKIRIISYTPNRGRGKALRTGIEHASGDIIVTTESDASYDEVIPHLISVLKKHKGIDVVIASPNLKRGAYVGVPFFRTLVSSVGNKVICRALPGRLTTATSMTRAYRAEVIKSLNLVSDRKEIHLEILSKILSLGFNVREVPAKLRWRKERKHRKLKFNYKKLIFSHLLFAFDETPFFLIGTVGIILVLLGLLSGAYVTYLWLNQLLNPSRPLIILSVILLLAGVQILLFSFLANQNLALRKNVIQLQYNIKKLRQ